MPLKEQLPDSNLKENLVTFTNLLRREGLPVSTTETMDALRALERVDLSSRVDFKSALQATLVKNRRDQDYFERLFEYFFAPPEVRQRGEEKAAAYKEQAKEQMAQATRELQFKGESLQLSPAELAQYSTMTSEQRGRLQDFMQKTESGVNVEESFRPILETLVKSHLRYFRTGSSRERGAQPSGGSPEGAGSGSGQKAALSEIDIQAISASELPQAEQLLQKLSRKLAVQILRRRRSGPRSGPLDLRRSLRDNMRYGGIIFKLKHRPKRRSREQILLLCDVSASMKQYSTFVIHFMHGLREAVRDLSCFSFSDGLENMTPELKKKGNLQHLLDRVIRRSEIWGGGTNLGRSLQVLLNKYPDLLNFRTTVIVVSDTKTIAIDQAAGELNKLKDRVRRIVWLNPLPPEQWSDFRSVEALGALTEMWPCSTISQLEAVLIGRLGNLPGGRNVSGGRGC